MFFHISTLQSSNSLFIHLFIQTLKHSSKYTLNTARVGCCSSLLSLLHNGNTNSTQDIGHAALSSVTVCCTLSPSSGLSVTVTQRPKRIWCQATQIKHNFMNRNSENLKMSHLTPFFFSYDLVVFVSEPVFFLDLGKRVKRPQFTRQSTGLQRRCLICIYWLLRICHELWHNYDQSCFGIFWL